MNIKERLQRVLQIVEESELSGSMSELDRDVVLAELREAYSAVKFVGVKEEESHEDVAEASEDCEPEVEFEIIYNEEDDEEELAEAPENETPTAENEDPAVEDPAVEEPAAVETPNAPNHPTIPTPTKRSPILSLYEDEVAAPIIGDLFSETPSVADTIACPKGVAESTPVGSLRESIGVVDKFMLIRELFDGDSDMYENAIANLDKQTSLDDCVIYIAENYAWSAQSQATKTIMSLLQRKFNE